MIRVQITEMLISDAELLMDDHQSFGERADHYSDEQLVMGALGEAALIDYCWNNDLLAFKN